METNQFYNTRSFNIHTNWNDDILKQKNRAASLYWGWANVYQTGT